MLEHGKIYSDVTTQLKASNKAQASDANVGCFKVEDVFANQWNERKHLCEWLSKACLQAFNNLISYIFIFKSPSETKALVSVAPQVKSQNRNVGAAVFCKWSVTSP